MTAAAPAAPAKKLTPAELKEQRARPQPMRFALILGELLVISALAWRFDRSYLSYAVMTVLGFSIHYWTPLRYKEYFWFAFSIIGTAWLAGEVAGPKVAVTATALTLATGLLVYGIIASPVRYGLRALGVAAVFAGFVLWGAFGRSIVRPPTGYFAIFGAAFCFRIFPYLYEAKHFKQKPSLRDFVRYFFMMPGFKLATVDYQKLGQSFYQRDINDVAQQGVRWIARGIIQYAVWLYCHDKVYWITEQSRHISFLGWVKHLVFGYTLYLSVSCRIHMWVGVMHLFGYDLPEPYRWFAFAHSPLDFWRRANVYWKDIMLKVVFMPVYFTLRKKGDLAAKLIAIGCVFATTWFLHLWNDSWKGQLSEPFWKAAVATPTMALFWGSYGVLCAGNTILESWEEKRSAGKPKKRLPKAAPPKNLAEAAWRYVVEHVGAPPGMHPVQAALQILAMQLAVSALFSLRHAPSLQAWIWTMSWWR
jgi:hypothetical protein